MNRLEEIAYLAAQIRSSLPATADTYEQRVKLGRVEALAEQESRASDSRLVTHG